MTASDTIFIEGNLSARESLELFLRTNNIPEEEASYSEDNLRDADGVWNDHAVIKILANKGIQTFMSEKYLNFSASTSLSFTPHYEDIRPIVQTALLRMALAVIKQYQWEVGIMLENLAETVLLYKDGILKIRRHNFWNAERLNMLDIPYSEVEIL